MPNKGTTGSLCGIVDKMNKTYDGLIGKGFSPGAGRRIFPVMVDGEVSGWKMQRYENDGWVDLDETQFETMKDLIEYYKGKE
jgi:hypothetical protein